MPHPHGLVLRQGMGTSCSKDDIVSLHIYTAETPIYRIVNEALRKGDMAVLQSWWFLVNAIRTALPQCPVHQGVAYRGINVAIDPELYMPGYVVTWRAFSSATTSAKVPLACPHPGVLCEAWLCAAVCCCVLQCPCGLESAARASLCPCC